MYLDDGSGSYEYCPFGQPGDILVARETWRPRHDEAEIEYRADGGVVRFLAQEDWFRDDWERGGRGVVWRPSIHMPLIFSRIKSPITGVRVERVQAITEDDARAEGSYWARHGDDGRPTSCYLGMHADAFREGWDGIYAKRGLGWDADPYVWVVEFKRVEETGDTVLSPKEAR